MKKRISDLVIPAERARVVLRFAHMSDDELRDRLAQIEANAAKAKAAIARGERGDFEGTVVRKGQHVPSYSNESCVNHCRRAWAQARFALMVREAATA